MTGTPTQWSLTAMLAGLKAGEITATALTDAHKSRIRDRSNINAFISLIGGNGADAGSGPLAGIPIAIKDNILVKGARCTCGSRMLADWVAPYDATVVERLRAAGAMIIGKTNCDEFGMGSSNENSHFGPVLNPADTTRVAGGSSGGSAAAVADFQVAAALGSDTGGSVRQPAAFCGVVGLKPTYGAVSRRGLVAFGSSLDQIGVLARDAAGAKAVYDVISGHDPRDSTSAAHTQGRERECRAIGLPRECFGDGLDPEIRRAVLGLAGRLRATGYHIVDVSLPNAQYAIAAYYVICCAEASSNLARYDGVTYGHRTDNSADLPTMYARTRAEGFGAEVKRRILLGTYVLSAGYYDAYYGTAQRVRGRITADFRRAFMQADCLLTPTTPACAFPLGEKREDPLAMYLQDVYTTSVNLAGLPAISAPCGKSSAGLPIGAQFIGRPFDEQLLLKLAGETEIGRDV